MVSSQISQARRNTAHLERCISTPRNTRRHQLNLGLAADTLDLAIAALMGISRDVEGDAICTRDGIFNAAPWAALRASEGSSPRPCDALRSLKKGHAMLQ